MLNIERDASIVCICHNDADGVFAGLLVKRKYPRTYVISTNYGKDFNMEKLGDYTFVVDFSFDSINTMKTISEHTNLIWIDHHACVDQAKSMGFEPEGLRRRDASAALLVWEYLYPNEQAPKAIKYVSDYDLWEWDKNLDALYFHYGLESVDIRPSDSRVMKIFERLICDDDYVDRIIQVGRKLEIYNKLHNKIVCEDGMFLTKLDGIDAVACNIKNVSSLLFESVDDKYKDIPLRILFSYFANIGQFRVSVFSNNPSIQAHTICARYGGGGHPGAAGFSTKKLPFELPKPGTAHPPYENLYKPLQELVLEEPLVRKSANSGNIPLAWSHQYASILGNFTAVVLNHPSVSVDALYSTGLCNMYSLGIFAFLTNTGWYRYRIYLLDPRFDLVSVCNALNDSIPTAGRTEFKIVGNSIWCYCTKLPELLEL